LGAAKTEPTLASIQAQISSLAPHGIKPQLPVDKVEEIQFGGLTLSEPPSYKLGDKV
jgi:hypothetical protein